MYGLINDLKECWKNEEGSSGWTVGGEHREVYLYRGKEKLKDDVLGRTYDWVLHELTLTLDMELGTFGVWIYLHCLTSLPFFKEGRD